MSDSIKVKVIQLGRGVYEFQGNAPLTLSDALQGLGIKLDPIRMDIRVNSLKAEMEQPLKDGDIITIIPPLKGGAVNGGFQNRKRAVRWLAGIGLCLVTLLWGEAGALAKPVTVAYSAVTGAQAVPWIAQEAGIFKKYGFDVQLVYIAGTSAQISTLMSGDVQFSQATGPGVIQAGLSGADVVFLTGNMKTFTWNLVARPEIRTMKELRGKVLGITRFGSATDFAVRFALERFKIDPQKDVRIIQVGGMAEVLAGLSGKKIDAALLSSPQHLTALDQGFYILLSLPDLNIPYQGNGLTTTRTFIARNEELVENFMKAYLEAIKYYKTNPRGTMKILEKYTRTRDPRVLEETYQFYTRLLDRVPYPTLEGIQMILDIAAKTNPAAKAKQPKDFVEERFLRELERSGFVDQLYAGR